MNPVHSFSFVFLDLRQVTVNFQENPVYAKREDKHFFLSPAACILTVQRMPELKFKLICSFAHEGGK